MTDQNAHAPGLTQAEVMVLRLLASLAPKPALVEHLLYAIDDSHADPDVVEAFGPRPRRWSLLTALGNLYDHWLVTSSPSGYTLTDKGQEALTRAR